MSIVYPEAPALQVARWFNTEADITNATLRGRVVVLHAFQMLCPACVSHGLPQTRRIQQSFRQEDVAVIGLHTVFEHHDVMTPDALQAFIQEYRYTFPIGIDQPGAGSIPVTMRAYELQGTPSLVLLDRHGRVRFSHFGVLDDILLGSALGQLIAEDRPRPSPAAPVVSAAAQRDACDEAGCRSAGTET